MRSANEHEDLVDSSAYRELQLLSEVEDTPDVTQRALSQRIGIALGLTNVLLRNFVQKGYIRATRASWKRWIYSLTPDGFTHKIRLTMAYVHRVLDHYQNVRQTLRQQLEPLALHEESRIAIYGTREFAELVYLGLKEYGIEEIDVFGSGDEASHKFLGMPVRDVATLQPEKYDRVVVAFLGDTEGACRSLRKRGTTHEKLVTFFAVRSVGGEG